MPSYTLELELLGNYATDMPGFEIWEDGSLDSSHSISSSGSSISVTISYGGALPSSLEFRFNDGHAEGGRTIEVQSVKINDRYVNTGNHLSSDLLIDGGSATVDVNGADYIFNNSADPSASEFTTGATQTFTAGTDNYNSYNNNAAQTFDMLAGDDYACAGNGDDKISGGAGNDVLRGHGGNDLLFGGADDDRLYGMDGTDTLYGGTGNDSLYGGSGNDKLHGGTGNDKLMGHGDDDLITGGDGADMLLGGAGNDILHGDAGDDRLIGGAGNDTIDGGDGVDIGYGGAGNDTIDGGAGDDILIGQSGDDVINGGADSDIIYGQGDNDTLHGGDGVDFVSGGDGIDTINGDNGNDVIVGGEGADTLNGGDGDDIIHGHGLTLIEIQTILNNNSDLTYNAMTNSFYQFVDTAGVDYATALSGALGSSLNGVTGHLANVTSQVEQDYLYNTFSLTDWTWLGGTDAGEESTWRWTHGAEAGVQFSNDDTPVNNMYTSWTAGQPNLGTNADSLHMYHGTGNWGDGEQPDDTGDYIIEWDAGLIFDDNASDTINGGGGIDTIYGYSGDDILDGGANGDIIFGGTGDDTILGGTGDDTIFSNEDDDRVTGGAGEDTMNGGAGIDTAVFEDNFADYTISVDGDTVTLIHNATGDTDTATLFENFEFDDQTVTIGDLAPVAITSNGAGRSTAITIAENTTSLTTVTATGPGTLTYSISGGVDAALFTIDATTGVLTFISAPDYEKPEDSGSNNIYDVEVKVSNGTAEDVQSVSVQVTDVDEGDIAGNTGTTASMNVGDVFHTDIESSGDTDYIAVHLVAGQDYTISLRGDPTSAGTNPDPNLSIYNSAGTHIQSNDDAGFGYESAIHLYGASVTYTGTYYIEAKAYGTNTGTLRVEVHEGVDASTTGTGSQTLNGGAQYDALTAGGGDDILNGNGGDDKLIGENGNDTLDGGTGADTLFGGGGADTFMITATDASDTIVDFTTADGDTLDLSSILSGFNAGTDDIDDFILFTTVGSDTSVRVDIDGLANGVSFTEVAVLQGNTGEVVQTLYDNGDIIV